MSRLVSLLFLAAAALPGLASAEELPVRIEEKVLANGLKVLAIRRPGLPHAACVLAVKAGSSSESPGQTGIAHFLEHMMFMGTETLGVKDPEKDKDLLGKVDALTEEIVALEASPDAGAERLAALRKERDALFKEQMENIVNDAVDKIYEQAGSAMTNAYTSEDSTVFFTMLPPHRIELFFWLEARRFRAPVFRQFHAELGVVREERRLSDNRPGNDFSEELDRVVYGSHPYAHPVLGYTENLARFTPGDLREFFETHYTADNMLALVGGDVDPAEVFRLAEAYFGTLPRGTRERPRVPVLQIPKAGAARVFGRGPGTPSLSVAYRMPPAGSPVELECEILALSLGDRDGALHRALVEEKGAATDTWAWYDNRRRAGVLWIGAGVPPGRDPADAEPEVLEAVRRLVEKPLADAEVKRLSRRYRADLLGVFKDDQRLGMAILHREAAGSWRDYEALLDKVLAVKAEDIRKVAAEFLVPDNRVTGIYEEQPATGEEAAAAPESGGTEPPAPAAPGPGPASLEDLKAAEKPFEIPDASGALSTLPNGIRVVAVPDADDPVFRIEAWLEGGSGEDPAGREGLARLLADAAGDSGVPGMGRKALREKMEELVAESGTGSGVRALSVSLNAFKARMPEGLALFQDLLLRRVLDAEAVKTQRESIKSSLVDEDADAAAVCSRAYERILWGNVPRTRRPSPASLDAVGREDLERALTARLDPRRCVIAVSGPFDRAAMLALLEKAFGGWKPAAPPAAPFSPGTASPEPPGLYTMEFDASQGYVLMGLPAGNRRDPAWPVLALASTILNRRIYERIRSREGLAYSASAWVDPDWDLPSLFTIEFQTKARSVPYAISLALEELRAFCGKPAEPHELDLARKDILSSLRSSLGRAADRAQSFARLALEAPGDTAWHRRYAKAVEGATAEDVRAAAARLLKREDLRILCVGVVAEMAAGDGEHPARLADFGPARALEPPAPPAAPKTPREVALFLVRKMAQGDVEAMKPWFSEEMRKAFEQPGAADELAAQGKMLAQAKSEVTECEEKGETANVAVKFSLTMGGQAAGFTLEFRFRSLAGRWLCEDIRPKE